MIKNDKKLKNNKNTAQRQNKAGYLFKYLALVLLSSAIISNAVAYNISITIENCGEKLVYLCKHRGPDFEIIDSLKTNTNGHVVFSGHEKLESGIYFIVIPPHTRFDFLIAEEQNISINTDMNNVIGKLQIKGEKQNQIFADLIKEVASVNRERANYNMQKQFFAGTMPDTVKYISQIIDSLDKHQQSLYIKYKNMLNEDDYLYKVLNLLSPIHIPPEIENSRLEDPVHYFNYTRRHFLDRIDFDEPFLINTPEFMFHKLIETYAYYFIELRSSDINEAKENSDFILQKAEATTKIHQYVLSYLLSKYQNHNDKRLEKLMVHLFDEHVRKEKPEWMDMQTYSVVEFFIESLRYNLIGNTAAEINLPDFEGIHLSMYALDYNYKIILFWEPGCDICEEQTLALLDEYEDIKFAGAQVIAVCVSEDKQKCKDFVKSNNLSWINLIDNSIDSEVRQKYGVIKTPRIYLLDKQHVIIAKDVRPAALYQYILNNPIY